MNLEQVEKTVIAEANKNTPLVNLFLVHIIYHLRKLQKTVHSMGI